MNGHAPWRRSVAMFGWRQEADRGQSLQRSRLKANGLTGAVDTGLFLTSAASRLGGVADLRNRSFATVSRNDWNVGRRGGPK